MEGGLGSMDTFELTQAEIDDFASSEPLPAQAESDNSLLANRSAPRARGVAVPVPEPIAAQRPRPVKTKWQNSFKVPSALQNIDRTGEILEDSP